MSRAVREDEPNAVWHVNGRVNWKAWHLESVRAHELFVAQLRRALESFDVDLLSFVLMSNHYHMALRSPDEERFRALTSRRTACRHRRPWPRGHPKSAVVSQCMRQLKFGVARKLQEELGLAGHFWDGKHYRRRICDAWDLVVAIAYDHRNPVRAGMVTAAEQYPRSTAGWWAGTGTSPVPVAIRAELPFGLDREEFRSQLLRYQSGKRLDDVMAAFAKRHLRADSPIGRAVLVELLLEAGFEDPFRAAALPQSGDPNSAMTTL